MTQTSTANILAEKLIDLVNFRFNTKFVERSRSACRDCGSGDLTKRRGYYFEHAALFGEIEREANEMQSQVSFAGRDKLVAFAFRMENR